MKQKNQARWFFLLFIVCLLVGLANLYKQNYLIAVLLAVCAAGNYLNGRKLKRKSV